MKKLIVGSLGLFTLCSVATSAAVALGRTAPYPPRVYQFHLLDCTIPCWAGMTPGKTTVNELTVRLKEMRIQIKADDIPTNPVTHGAILVANSNRREQVYIG